MSHVYTGNSALASTTYKVTLPSDGDGPGIKAADVNVALEALADMAAAAGKGITPITVDFLANGTFHLPSNALTTILAYGWGSGGGGGGGNGGAGFSIPTEMSGGGGGAAAVADTRVLLAVPNTDYAVTIGAAANGAATNGGNGFGGNATTLGALTTFAGARTGGFGGGAITEVAGPDQNKMLTCGGEPFGQCGGTSFKCTALTLSMTRTHLAQGGYGATKSLGANIVGQGGRNCSGGFAGGIPGSVGGASGGDGTSGGPGGGGAAGPGGAGGAGGNGQAGAFSVPLKAQNGADAAANTGAGGGGGGGAGQSDSSYSSPGTGDGGNGGASGSGFLRVTYFVPTGA